MGKRTEMITYNVHDRGRKLTGQDRRFDTVALARLINSPQVQESVKSGDIQGYLGHWPRVKFGMATQEGGVLDGKAISLPLAVRAVHVSADEDGNITHQHEFLDTHEGRLASSLYDSKTGGFSSAIDAVPRSSPSLPTAFFGFDYVFAPNYNTNRGHRVILDSIGADAGAEEHEEMMALLDAVAGESSIAFQMFDSLQAQHQLAMETLERLAAENDLLISRLASGKPTSALLDDIVGEGGRVAPRRFDAAPDFDKFRSMPLVALAALPTDSKADTTPDGQLLRNHYGLKD